jgi:hypothetical protein
VVTLDLFPIRPVCIHGRGKRASPLETEGVTEPLSTGSLAVNLMLTKRKQRVFVERDGWLNVQSGHCDAGRGNLPVTAMPSDKAKSCVSVRTTRPESLGTQRN